MTTMTPAEPHDPLPPDWQHAFGLWRSRAWTQEEDMVHQHLGQGPAHLLPHDRPIELGVFTAMERAWRAQLFELTLWRLMATVSPEDADSIVLNVNHMQEGKSVEGFAVHWKPDASKANKRVGNAIIQKMRTVMGSTRQGWWLALQHRHTGSKLFVFPTGLSLGEALPLLVSNPSVLAAYEQHVLATTVPEADGVTQRSRMRL